MCAYVGGHLGTELLESCCGLIPDTGPYTKAEANQRLTKAATYAALLLCDHLKVDKSNVLKEADPQFASDYEVHHTPSWDAALAWLLDELRTNASNDEKVILLFLLAC